MTGRRVFGLETEHGCSLHVPPDVRGVPCGPPAANLLFDLGSVRRDCDTSRLDSANQWLENGARLYIDSGEHPEYATPECSTIEELVAADTAGRLILAAMAERAEAALRAGWGDRVRLRVRRNNLSPAGVSWGCHESYQVPVEVSWSEVTAGLGAHLASRVVYCGQGTMQSGAFTLSQRALITHDLVNSAATNTKPMILARDEPLADWNEWRRVQVASGDACMAETGTALKVGATLAVLALGEHGRVPVTVDPAATVAAFKAWSADRTLRLRCPTSVGWLTAVEVQRCLWAAAVRHADLLPAAARSILPLWGEVLDGLTADPAELSDRLDWPAKLALLERAEARGASLMDLQAIDLAYADIRPGRSLHLRLLDRGLMRRFVPARASVTAMSHPPATTRAWARGRLIDRLRQHGAPFSCEWTKVLVHRWPGPVTEVEMLDPGSPWSDDADLIAVHLPGTLGEPRVFWPWPSPDALAAETSGRTERPTAPTLPAAAA